MLNRFTRAQPDQTSCQRLSAAQLLPHSWKTKDISLIILQQLSSSDYYYYSDADTISLLGYLNVIRLFQAALLSGTCQLITLK